jgi:translation initiation factor 2B subunit (eIF-2B alpha/beta/delta family)
MRDQLSRLLERIEKDDRSGASAILDYALSEVIGSLGKGTEMPSKARLRDFAIDLFHLRGAMAPIFHLSNRILLFAESADEDAEGFRDALLEWRMTEQRAMDHICRSFADTVEARSILTVSHSSTVESALIFLAGRATIHVTVLESLPGGEGMLAAKRLSERGIDARIVADSMVFVAVRETMAAVCGADAVTRYYAVNKVGTAPLALACQAAERPMFLLCSSSKFTPLEQDDMIPRHSVREGVAVRNQVFEKIPLSLFSLVITEKGVFDPSEIPGQISSIGMAKAWREAGLCP